MSKRMGLYVAAGLLAVVATVAVPVLAIGEQGPPMGRGPIQSRSTSVPKGSCTPRRTSAITAGVATSSKST